MRPLGNRILVKRIVPEAKKGTVLLISSEEKVKTGIVIEIGPGKPDRDGFPMNMNVYKDDRIIFPMYSGTPVIVDDTNDEYLIISADEILAVLED